MFNTPTEPLAGVVVAPCVREIEYKPHLCGTHHISSSRYPTSLPGWEQVLQRLALLAPACMAPVLLGICGTWIPLFSRCSKTSCGENRSSADTTPSKRRPRGTWVPGRALLATVAEQHHCAGLPADASTSPLLG